MIQALFSAMPWSLKPCFPPSPNHELVMEDQVFTAHSSQNRFSHVSVFKKLTMKKVSTLANIDFSPAMWDKT